MMNSDLFTPFSVEPYDEFFAINCGEINFPCPIFDEKENNIFGWVPSKNYSQTSSDRLKTSTVEKWSGTQRPSPICIDDEIFQNKTPIWTNRHLITRRLRNRGILDKIIPVKPSEGLKFVAGHDRWPPLWFESLAINEIDPGPASEEGDLGNCLSLIDIKDDVKSILAFSYGRLHESIQFANVNWYLDDRKRVNCEVDETAFINLSSKLLALNVFPNENESILCRTVENVQLLTLTNDQISKSVLIPNERVKFLVPNPYIQREFCSISDKEQKISFGSINGSNEVLYKNSLPIDQLTVNGLEWSDHPRCVFINDETRNLFLFDVRSPIIDLISSKFWFAPSEFDIIRCIKRIDDDTRYLLVATDQSLFVLDHRQPFKALATVVHMMVDSVKYLNVSNKISRNFGDNRLITLTGRELNQQVIVPLIWDESTSTICELEPPRELWSVEHTLNWFRLHSPNVPLSNFVQDRFCAPIRGVGIKKFVENRLISLILNDVGDLSFSAFEFGSTKSIDDLELISSRWKNFIETRSCLIAERQSTSKNVDDDVSVSIDVEMNAEKCRKSKEKCKFCRQFYGLNENVCQGCRLERQKIDDLLKCGQFLLPSTTADVIETTPNVETNSGIDALIINAWMVGDLDEEEILT